MAVTLQLLVLEVQRPVVECEAVQVKRLAPSTGVEGGCAQGALRRKVALLGRHAAGDLADGLEALHRRADVLGAAFGATDS